MFNFTDHLGNIGLSYSKDPATNVLKIIEENHYYPFGLKHSGYNSDKMMYSKEGSTVKIKPVPPLFVTSYDKKFNGKSWETELGLNIYDFDARGYMPDIVRTFQVDPLAEMFYDFSPQSFLNNNPLHFIDPTGMGSEDWKRDTKGKMVFDKNLNQLNSGYTLGIGEQYVGTSHYEVTTNNNMQTHTLYKEDGSIISFENEVPTPNTNNDKTEYSGYLAGYFNGVPAGEYGPYIPDATGITLSCSVNTGLFGNFSGNFGFAIDRQNNTDGFVGGNFELGVNDSKGIPSFNLGLTIDFHDNYIEGQNNVSPTGVLSGLGGENRTYAGGFGNIIGGYSYSAENGSGGYTKSTQGVETKSLGIGLNSGMSFQVGGSRSFTVSELIKKHF